MAKVYAPLKDYNGISASVTFVNGVGETDNENLLEWFEEKGYTVEREKPKRAKKATEDATEEVAEEVAEGNE